MVTRYEDEEDNLNDGFHFDDPESDDFGKERVLDVGALEDQYEPFLSRERAKLTKGDRFASLDFDQLDRNGKRRAQRMIKRFEGVDGVKSKHIELERINGYDFYRLAYPPYNLDYLSELAVENSTHYRCIEVKSINIVGSGYKWLETSKVRTARMNVQDDDDKTEKLARKLQRVTDQLDEWLESLNQDETFTETLLRIWKDVEATGNGYLEIGRNMTGKIAYVGHIPSNTMRIRVDRDGFMQMIDRPDKMVFFRNYGDRKTVDPMGRDPRPNEVIHFKKNTPKSSYYGVPDIIASMTAVAGEKFASEYNLDFFENKAVPRYALIIKGAKLTAQAERRILEYFRKEVKGKHHGTLYIPVPAPMGTNVDVQLMPIENKIQEGSFVKYRQENRLEIASTHGVPLSKLSIEGAGGGSAGARESDKNFKIQVCRPGQMQVRSKVDLLLKEITDMFTLGFIEYDLVDEETKSRIHDRYLRNGVINPNEIRGEIGLHPRRGGDVYVDLAAESQAKIELTLQQAAAATMLKTPTTGGGGSTAKKPGAPRKTLDGGKNTPGSTKTPSSQSGTPRRAMGQGIAENGTRARDR